MRGSKLKVQPVWPKPHQTKAAVKTSGVSWRYSGGHRRQMLRWPQNFAALCIRLHKYMYETRCGQSNKISKPEGTNYLWYHMTFTAVQLASPVWNCHRETLAYHQPFSDLERLASRFWSHSSMTCHGICILYFFDQWPPVVNREMLDNDVHCDIVNQKHLKGLMKYNISINLIEV